MAEIVHERAVGLVGRDGIRYELAVVYSERQGSTWAGWIEFHSADRARVVRTDRETTQPSLEGVAYWAEGLEVVYLEGALDRATRRTADTRPVASGASPRAGAGIVRLRLESIDPQVPFALMASRNLVPGQRRQIFEGGVLVFLRTLRAPGAGRTGLYELAAQFGSANAAGIMANTLWNDLHGRGATLQVEGTTVEMTNDAIKDALLGAPVA